VRKTEKIALVGLGITAIALGFIVMNDSRLIKSEKDSSAKKPFVTRERQNFLMRAAIAKIALTGIIITYITVNENKN